MRLNVLTTSILELYRFAFVVSARSWRRLLFVVSTDECRFAKMESKRYLTDVEKSKIHKPERPSYRFRPCRVNILDDCRRMRSSDARLRKARKYVDRGSFLTFLNSLVWTDQNFHYRRNWHWLLSRRKTDTKNGAHVDEPKRWAALPQLTGPLTAETDAARRSCRPARGCARIQAFAFAFDRDFT